MQDVGAQHFIFAGQGVDDDFDAGGAKGEIVERPAACLRAVIKNLRCFVVARARQRHLAKVRLLDQAFKAQQLFANAYLAIAENHRLRLDLIFISRKGHQTLLDDVSGVLRSLAVQIAATGGGGRRGVRHFVGIGCSDLHPADVNLEHFGHHLRHFDVQALAHLGATMIEVDAAIGVDVDQCAGLIEKAGSKGNTEFDRG